MQVDQLTGTPVGRYLLRGRLQLLPYATVHRGAPAAGGDPVLVWVFREPYTSALGFLEALQRLAGDKRAAGLPGIVHTIEIGTQDLPTALTYLVDEDAPGGFLVGLLQRGEAPGVLATAAALGQALDGLHRQGMVHGDVQPATVAVGAAGRPVLIGLGIRTVVTRVNPQAAWLDATRGFRPPEGRTDPTPAADLYGLAALTYYLLVGRPPHAEGAVDAPSAIRPQLPAALDQVMLRALSPDPRERYRSAGELVAAVRAGIVGRSPGAPASAKPGAQPAPPTSGPAPPQAPQPVAAGPGESTYHPWQPAERREPAASRPVSLIPAEPLELRPNIRRRSGIVLLGVLAVVAAALLTLSAMGRLYL